MKKTKLEVIRINEDVIATSGVVKCQHHDAFHFYSEVHMSGNELWGDKYNPLSYSISSDSINVNYSLFEPNLNENTEVGKYYYYDGSVWHECIGDHSEYERDGRTYFD